MPANASAAVWTRRVNVALEVQHAPRLAESEPARYCSRDFMNTRRKRKSYRDDGDSESGADARIVDIVHVPVCCRFLAWRSGLLPSAFECRIFNRSRSLILYGMCFMIWCIAALMEGRYPTVRYRQQETLVTHSQKFAHAQKVRKFNYFRVQ